VARAYYSLPPAERAETAISQRLRPVRAIDFYGPRYGLPKSIGGIWQTGPGVRASTRQSLLVLGDDRQTLEQKFEVVVPMAQDRPPVRHDAGALHAVLGPEAARLHAAERMAATEEVE